MTLSIISTSSIIIPTPYPIRRRHVTTRPKMSLSDPLTTLTRLLWGKSLPPQLLVSTVRSTWSSTWHLLMSQLAPSTPSGSYSRPPSPFPSVPDPTIDPSHLHLYVGRACPWAHRALIARSVKSLDADVTVTVAAPDPNGPWGFGDGRDPATGAGTLAEVYRMRSGGFDGRSTVPMLWDKRRREVVCNDSYGIVEFFDRVGSGPELAPPELKGRIEVWNRIVYPNVNNGVYRCGFAQSQEAYDAAVSDLFGTLDTIDAHLATSRYLCGNTFTLADVCLFTTLIRFDLVYNILFKCTKKKLVEYANLHAYTRDIYQIPKVAETCHFEAIMDGYYRILFPLNPGGIRPIIPSDCEPEFLNKPHGREALSSP